MKHLIYLITIPLLLMGCAKEETFNDVAIDNQKTITFRVVGLDTDVQKHITIFCAGEMIDTVITGSYFKEIKTNQSIVNAKIKVKTAELVNNTISIECKNIDAIHYSSDCDNNTYYLEYLFNFTK